MRLQTYLRLFLWRIFFVVDAHIDYLIPFFINAGIFMIGMVFEASRNLLSYVIMQRCFNGHNWERFDGSKL